MKKSFYLCGLVAALAGLILGACASAAQQPAQPSDLAAKTEAAAVEKTLYVGPSQVDCTGVARRNACR